MNHFIAILILFCSLAFSIEEHESKINNQSPRGSARPNKSGVEPEGCKARPSDIAAFANGEAYHFKSMVNFISSPECLSNHKIISQQAMAEGVTFNSVPFRLDFYSKNFTNLTFEGKKQLENSLLSTVPQALSEHPLSTSELLPIVGQLSILSPQTARQVLTYTIEQELIASDSLLEKKLSTPQELAKTLVRMGTAENAIASEISKDLEEKAYLAQAESLGKILKGLALAAQVEESLIPAYQLSTGAVNQGIKKAKKQYSKDSKQSLAESVFFAIYASANEKNGFEPANQELNEAIAQLLSGTKKDKELLKKIWDQTLTVLSKNNSQKALAKTVGVSLSENMIFLTDKEQKKLLLAAQNYPELSYLMQMNLLEIIENTKEELHQGSRDIASYNSLLTKYYEPWVSKILQLEMRSLDPIWLQEMLKKGLVKDEDIEKRFPHFVLSSLEKKEKLGKVAVMEDNLENHIASSAENFAQLWTLSHVQIPALSRWVDRYDKK